MKPAKTAIRKTGAPVLLLTGTLIFCFVVAEVAIRFIPAERIIRTYIPEDKKVFDPDLRRILYPNVKDLTRVSKEYRYSITTNQEGFRDFHDVEKKEGVFRILGLGDSFTFGYPVDVERTYLSRLEKIMPDVETINLGIGGFSAPEESIVLSKFGLKYQPDLVLVQLYVNDIHGAYVFTQRKESPHKKSLLHWIMLKSRLIAWAYWEINSSAWGGKLVRSLNLNVDRRNSYAFVTDLSRVDSKSKPETMTGVRVTFDAIRDIKQVCKNNGAQLGIFYIPALFQVNEETHRSFDREYNTERLEIDIQKTQAILEDFLEQEGIPFFDYTEDIKHERQRRELYFLEDQHLNEEGYAFLARLLKKDIEDTYFNGQNKSADW